MKNKAKIKAIAIKAREIVSSYKFDIEFDKDMRGLCAISSFFLCKLLVRESINTRIIWGKVNSGDHCWIEAYDHVIDITATQFGHKELEIFPMYEKFKRGYTDYKRSRCNYLSFYNFRTWEDAQKPTPKLINSLMKKF